nr:hypothetical protein [Staphylococcus epidermidis]
MFEEEVDLKVEHEQFVVVIFEYIDVVDGVDLWFEKVGEFWKVNDEIILWCVKDGNDNLKRDDVWEDLIV